MSKFNAKSEPRKGRKVTNYMGETANTQSLKEELAFLCLTSFVENSYYEKASDALNRLRSLVQECVSKDSVFVAKLAVYVRTQAHMRSIFHVLVGELARNHSGDNLVGRAIYKGVTRVDDMTEILSYVKSYTKKIPNQVKTGLARSFDKFDEYQLAKYRGENKKVSLVDVVNLVHPKPNQRNSEALKKLVAGTLRNVSTWETKVSAAGGSDKSEAEVKQAKEDAWEELLRNRKMNVMGVLRNLRNILETGNKEIVDLACKVLGNRKLVQNSRQLPFRFLSAYEEVEKLKKESSLIKFEKSSNNMVDKVLATIEQACLFSVNNLPNLSGTTAILSDNSGSMRGDRGGSSAVSANSKRTTADIGNLFSLLYWYRSDNTYVGLFGDHLSQFNADRSVGLFENFKNLDKLALRVGQATEQGIYNFFNECLSSKVYPDRVVIFSDCQIGSPGWYGMTGATGHGAFGNVLKRFQKESPNTQIFCVNLKGYGNTVFNGNVVEISGWSDKIFSILENNDKGALVKAIEATEL